jgi:MFS family permease
MLWHYLFAITLLICSVGLVWYIAPNYSHPVEDWIAMVASGGIGVAIGLIALMRLTADAVGARAGAARLGLIAAVAIVIGLLAWLATPSDWRVGVGTLAVALVALNYWAFRNDPRPAEAQ